MLLIMGVSLYMSRIVLKNLGVEDFGIYNVVGGIVSMFAFINGSLGGATSRYITVALGKHDEKLVGHVFNAALLIHIALAVIIIILAETVGLWFFYNKMTIPDSRMHAAFWVYQISIITSFFSLTQVPFNATIIAHENMKIYAWVGLIEAFVKLGICFLLAISPWDKLIFYAILLCCVQIGIMIIYRIYCLKKYNETKIKIYRGSSLYKEMFGYTGADLIGNISVLAQGQGLNLLLNVFFGPSVNAARAIAYQVQGVISQFSGNFMTAVKPQIIKRYTEGRLNEMFSLVSKSSCYSYYLMWIIVLPIMLETKYILHLWLGAYPKETPVFMILILILCLIQTLKTPRTTIFHAMGKLKLVNTVVGSILCFAFPLAYIFLKLGFSSESVFWAAIISMILSESASVFILKKYFVYSIKNYLLKVHVKCFFITIISSIIPFLLYQKLIEPSFIRLIYTLLLTTSSISITVYAFGLNPEEREKILMIIKKRIMK